MSDTEVAEIYRRYQEGTPIETPSTGMAGIGAVLTGKRLFRRGESGVATVVVRNGTATAQAPTVTLTSRCWLRTERTLATRQTPKLHPGETVTVTIPFTLSETEEEMGCELRASVGTQSASEFISVSNNLGEVGISGYLHPAAYSKAATHLITRDVRKQYHYYANWMEWFFWAPDDWGLMTPTGPSWFSGQARYQVFDVSLRKVIEEAHRRGMKMITYGKHQGGGPEGWELVRRHPEYFLPNALGQPSGNWDVEDLEKWQVEGRRPKYGWYHTVPDIRRVDALDHGIAAILASIKAYGWDGVRFDGHYTTGVDALSAWNMRRLKETVWKAAPGFQFGFNVSSGPGNLSAHRQHEMREGMAGGGMWAVERLKSDGYGPGLKYATWTRYAEHELTVAKAIQALGGSYHGYLRLDDSAKSLYKLIYALIAGGHPIDGTHQLAIGCSNWGKFMTRWSAFLWHPRLRPVASPAAVATVSAPGLYWQPLMQDVVASPSRKFTVLHLVNPSPSNNMTETTLPAPVSNITVTLTAPDNVTRVVLVRPEHEPFELELKQTTRGRLTTVTVPRITCWGMVIFELSGKFTLPAPVPAFTEQPDPDAVEKGRASSGQFFSDPMFPSATGIELRPTESLWEADEGGSGITAKYIMDADANNAVAQVRERGDNGGLYFGRTWMGLLAPGRYVPRIRIKLEDDSAPDTIDRQAVTIYVKRHTKVLPGVNFSTDAAMPPERRLIVDGKYHYYTLPEWECTEMTTMGVYGIPISRESSADNRFLWDHVIIEQLEQYTDADLEAKVPAVDKPKGLRAPNGAAPAKLLQVKGLFWQPYGVADAVTCANSYLLPASYEELYAYDAVVCVNVDFSTSDYAMRKRLKDFVTDGGRLVILGGPFTLGVGGVQGTYLDDMLPFTLTGRAELIPCAPPLLLGRQPGKPYPDSPALLWRHAITAKPGIVIDAYAGTTPIAARKTTGNGQVVIFAGTVQGDPQGEAKPFWACESWRALLRQLLMK
ncbi:MAG: hypothetical protein BWY76_01334 [bacterium ADurb.Bin429]|nr:MAG: hypothetical protein BWY76_01334 [bacterium ADurb.Bin429]